MNQLRSMQRSSLYMLKRQYGSPLDIYKLVDSSTDVTTGKRLVKVDVYHIPRGVVLPTTISRTTLMRKMAQGTEAAHSFTVSGAYDTGLSSFIIDRSDCPGLKTLTVDDWISYNNRKYQIHEIESYEVDMGWIITAEEMPGEVPMKVTTVSLMDQIVVTDGVTHE